MRILALAILTIGDGFNRAGGGPDVRSGLSGLPARVRPGYLLRLPLRVAASVKPAPKCAPVVRPQKVRLKSCRRTCVGRDGAPCLEPLTDRRAHSEPFQLL